METAELIGTILTWVGCMVIWGMVIWMGIDIRRQKKKYAEREEKLDLWIKEQKRALEEDRWRRSSRLN